MGLMGRYIGDGAPVDRCGTTSTGAGRAEGGHYAECRIGFAAGGLSRPRLVDIMSRIHSELRISLVPDIMDMWVKYQIAC